MQIKKLFLVKSIIFKGVYRVKYKIKKAAKKLPNNKSSLINLDRLPQQQHHALTLVICRSKLL